MQGWYNNYKSTNLLYHNKKTKDKTHLTISLDTEKLYCKIQHYFKIKTTQPGIEVNSLNLIKGIYEKLTANIIPNGKRQNAIPLKIRNETRLFTFTISILLIVPKVLARAIKKERKRKKASRLEKK